MYIPTVHKFSRNFKTKTCLVDGNKFVYLMIYP